MKFLCFLPIIFNVVFITSARSQNNEVLDKIYGYDPTLYNGKVYRFHVKGRSIGTPFLDSHDFSSGSVKIKGTTYTDLQLNYDIFNQQLVYQFTNQSNGLNRIIVSDAWLQSFKLGDSYFESYEINNTRKIYRVIGEKPYRVMYYFVKELKVDNQVGSNRMIFSSPIRTSYLNKGNEIYRYSNNRSFLQHFSKEMQMKIRKYLREHHVNMKKSNDTEILQLLAFINSNV